MASAVDSLLKEAAAITDAKKKKAAGVTTPRGRALVEKALADAKAAYKVAQQESSDYQKAQEDGADGGPDYTNLTPQEAKAQIDSLTKELEALDTAPVKDPEGPQVGESRPVVPAAEPTVLAAPPAATAALAQETAVASAAADAIRAEAAQSTGAASTVLVPPTAPPRAVSPLATPNVPQGTILTPEVATALTSFVNESLLAAPTAVSAPGSPTAAPTLLGAGPATTGPTAPRVNKQPKVLRTGIQETLLTGLTASKQFAGFGTRRTLLGVG
jgi:hypothetical protein